MIFLRPDILVLILTAIILSTLVLTNKKQWLPYLGVALTISVIWNLFASSQYGYNQTFLSIGPISIFPLLAWMIGLFSLHILYISILPRTSFEGFTKQLLFYIALYWPILLIAETIGYHSLNIKNSAAAQYPGLPFCDCLHAPLWMQIAYLMIGPAYFLCVSFVPLKRS